MPEITFDGPLDLDALQGAFRCEVCGAVVHKWGPDAHVAFHRRLESQQL